MLTLIFNKDLENEEAIKLSTIYERPLANILTGSYTLAAEEASEIPTYEALIGINIQNVALYNGNGLRIPLSGVYNAIGDLSCTYDDRNDIFNMNVTLVWNEAEETEEEEEN